MRETERDTTFETSLLTVNPRINPSIVLIRAYLQVNIPTWLAKKFTAFRLLEDTFMKLPLLWHDLIISLPHVQQPLPINFPQNPPSTSEGETPW